jgi:hypothetical protein
MIFSDGARGCFREAKKYRRVPAAGTIGIVKINGSRGLFRLKKDELNR